MDRSACFRVMTPSSFAFCTTSATSKWRWVSSSKISVGDDSGVIVNRSPDIT